MVENVIDLVMLADLLGEVVKLPLELLVPDHERLAVRVTVGLKLAEREDDLVAES